MKIQDQYNIHKKRTVIVPGMIAHTATASKF